LFSLAVSPAQAKAQDNTPNPNSATPAGIAQLVSHMSISKEGFLVLNQKDMPESLNNALQQPIQQVQIKFSEINAHLKELPISERPLVITNAQGKTQIQWLYGSSRVNPQRWCVWVPNWVFDTIGWIATIYAGGWVTAGIFVGITVGGAPVGAILGAIGLWYGISASFLIWYADKYYPNGKTVCF
jgi:hypothetical protein